MSSENMTDALIEQVLNKIADRLPGFNPKGDYPPRSMRGYVDINKVHVHVMANDPKDNMWYQRFKPETRYYAPDAPWCKFNNAGQYLCQCNRLDDGSFLDIAGTESLQDAMKTEILFPAADNEKIRDIEIRQSRTEDQLNRMMGLLENIAAKVADKEDVAPVETVAPVQKRKAGRPKKEKQDAGKTEETV